MYDPTYVNVLLLFSLFTPNHGVELTPDTSTLKYKYELTGVKLRLIAIALLLREV